MRLTLPRWSWLISCLMMLLMLSGCFQPAGTGLEATIGAQEAPTLIPPTETLVPTSDTLVLPATPTTPDDVIFAPSDTPIPSPTPIIPTDTPTLVPPTLEPSFTPFQSLNLFSPTPPPGTEVALAQEIDPLAQTATAIVEGATQTAEAPMTLTAAFLFQPPSPTPGFGFATEVPGFATSAPLPGATLIPGTDCIHQVRAEDQNLYRIALRYGSTVEDIARASGIVNPNIISIGQRLTIPGCGTLGVTPPPTDTPLNTNATTTTNPNTTSGTVGQTYVVHTGDTLFALSIRFGVSVESLASANGLSNINMIYIGQTLNIP